MRRIVYLLVLSFSAALQAAPQLTPPSDLPPAADASAALAVYPGVLAAQARLAAAGAESRRLRAGDYEYQARAGYTRRNESGLGGMNDWTVGIERGWRLPGKAKLDAETGEALVAGAGERVGEARHEAARDLIALWYAELRGQSEADVWREQIALLQRQRDVVARRIKAGDAARMEGAQAAAAISQAQAELRRAETAQAAAGAMLAARFPGLPAPVLKPGPLLAVSGSAEEWAAAALEDNHELSILQKESERMRILARRQQADLRPDPTLGLHFSRERSGQDNLLGVSLSLPLPGEGRRARVAVAREETRALAQLEAAAKARIEGEIRAAYMQLQGALSRQQAQEDMARQLDGYADLAWRAYQLGETGLAEALNARKSARDARREALTTRLDAHEAAARLLLDSHQLWLPESGHEHR